MELQRLHEREETDSATRSDRSQYKALSQSATGETESETEGDPTSRPQKTGTVTILKSLWYIVALALINLMAAVVFMGIEGHHQETLKYKNLELQLEFNLTQERLLCKKRGLGAACFDSNQTVRKYYHKLYRNLTRAAEIQCGLVELELSSWNNKSRTENIMYAISIISTVGWGIYHPHRRSVILKVITIIYAFFGLPLFAGLLGFAHEGVVWVERRTMRLKWVRQNIGNTKLLGLVAMVGLMVFVVVYAALSCFLQRELHETVYEKLLLQLHSGPAVHDYNWSLLTGIYYVFTTISCIGFGDVYIYDPHPFVWFLKPISLFMVTAMVIALLAHAFQRAQNKVEKSFHALAKAHTVKDIEGKIIKYKKAELVRRAAQDKIKLGTD